MNAIPSLIALLAVLTFSQDPCEPPAIQELVESSDLVAIASLDESGVGLFSDRMYLLQPHRVFKGVAPQGFLFTSPNFEFEQGITYLVFGSEIDHLRFHARGQGNHYFTATKLEEVDSDVVEFLEARWVSDCYSKEQEDAMRGKANTRELRPFCGCDGKNYENFGHLQASGITQYTPGDCESALNR